jgi:hypothetical protein
MISRRQFMKISPGTVAIQRLAIKALSLNLLQWSATIWCGEPT